MTPIGAINWRSRHVSACWAMAWLLLVVLSTGSKATGAAEVIARSKPGADREAWAKIDAGRNAKTPDDAEGLFREAEAHARSTADTWAQGAAVNCRAMLAAQRGRADEAVALLSPLPFAQDDPEGFVFKYNLGRVLEDKKDRSVAIKAYETSLSLRPDYDTARDRLYDLFLKGAPDVPRALWAGDLLLRHGQAALVAARVLDLLEKWGADPHASALLVQLAQVYGASGWDAQRFRSTDEPRVRKLGETQPTLKSVADQLVQVFEGESPGTLAAWRNIDGGPAAMSRLLMSLADGNLGAEPPQVTAAAARYEAAWRIDTNNTDAPVAYASLLARYTRDVDSSGERLRSFINSLIDQKGQLYSLPTRSRADWVNLLRLHTILAQVFDQNPSLSRPSEIYTSVYHWTRATEIQETIRKTIDPTFPLSPRLYIGLAAAQGRDPAMTAKAWNSYVQAAAVCGPNDKAVALTALKGAQDVATKLTLDPAQLQKFNQTTSHVQSLVGPDAQRATTLPASTRWLPAEYRAGNLSAEQLQKLGAVNEKYEKLISESPLKSADIAKDRATELDALLDPAQREQVNRARTNRNVGG